VTFIVSVPAADRGLLTLAEIKTALGITDTSQDATLTALGLQVSAIVTSYCRVPSDGISPPTLRRETVVQTTRIHEKIAEFMLSRRFVASGEAISVDGEALAVDNYEVDRSAGLVRRLISGRVVYWSCGTVVVTYQAGLEPVPDLIKRAATNAIREQWSELQRDPLIKREREKLDGVSEMETEYWVNSSTGSSSANGLSGQVRAMLDEYRYFWLGE
jgi:hypothetical protein